MKSSMRQILEALLGMPYYRNYQASSGAVHNISKHEDAVKDILIKHGLSEVDDHSTKGFRKKRDLWLQDASKCDMKDGTFISQPCGTHDSPDFIVKVGGKLEFLECKSSKQPYPTYNSGLPKKGYIYLLSSEKTDSTTFFRGEDVVSDSQRKVIETYEPEIERIINELNSELRECDVNERGITLYFRAMWTQVGGASKKDYFQHSQRVLCEQKVLDAV